MKPLTQAEFEKRFPLTAPTCPYCEKATARRRRFWRSYTRVACKTPNCGAWGENSGPRGEWLWSKVN